MLLFFLDHQARPIEIQGVPLFSVNRRRGWPSPVPCRLGAA
jgi:hypothetical protein